MCLWWWARFMFALFLCTSCDFYLKSIILKLETRARFCQLYGPKCCMISWDLFVLEPRKFKGWIGSLFQPLCYGAAAILVVTHGRELTFGFEVIIQHDLPALSLSCDSLQDNIAEKSNSFLPGGLSYEKIQKYNSSAPFMTPRWPLQRIPPKFPCFELL